MKCLRKKYGWKIYRGFTILELIISIFIWTTIIGFSSSVFISIYKHKLFVDNINEISYKKSDIEIDLKHRLLSDLVIKYEVKDNKIISYLKKVNSYDEKKIIEVVNNKLVENHYYKSNDTFFLLKEVVISKDINKVEFFNKGKLIYAKLDIKGEECLICI